MLFLLHTDNVVLCPILPEPDYSDVTYTTSSNTGYTVGTIAIFLCRHNYWLKSGNLFRTCSSNGTWTGTQAICAGEVKCFANTIAVGE